MSQRITGLLKTLPHEWVPEILILNLKTCKIPRNYENVNKNDRSIRVAFEKEDLCEKFYKEFNTNMIKSINDFIVSKKEEPKHFNRIIVVESTVETRQIIFRY